jgi:hypothetical protein
MNLENNLTLVMIGQSDRIILCHRCGITRLDAGKGKLTCLKCDCSYQPRRVFLKILSGKTKQFQKGRQ